MTTEKKSKKGTIPYNKVCDNCSAPEGSDGVPKLSACARCSLVVYCSKDCQRAHWKAGHKQRCIAKADRALQQEAPLGATYNEEVSKTTKGEECSICLDPLDETTSCTLECTHTFHATCVAELRKFRVKQTCPLCRTPLPPGPEKLCDDAFLRYVAVYRQVSQGKASWTTLPPALQIEMAAVVTGWQTAADQGYADAQHNLGLLYEGGQGVAQSYTEAALWYKKAAEQGEVAAQISLAHIFEDGHGVAQSDEEAVRWFIKAADQGNPEGQTCLGVHIFSGTGGFAQSDEEALPWFQKGAEQENEMAQFCLGDYSRYGLGGVARNKQEALRWYKLAADQGFEPAQDSLEELLQSGRGAVKRR